jgi:hypothetical protein
MQPNIVKSAMSYGLILGALFSVNFLLSLTNNSLLGLLGWIIVAAILVATYKMAVRYRDKDCEGFISYGKAFSLVVLMFFFAAIISAFVKFIYLQFIDVTYLERQLEQAMLVLETMAFPITDEIYKTMSAMLTPTFFSISSIFTNMFLGVFTGLIMAGFVKKEKGLFDDKKEIPENN